MTPPGGGSRGAPAPLLLPGQTCWRVEDASRVALLVDNAAYFATAAAALRGARRSILLVAWTLDPRAELEPGGPSLGAVLNAVAEARAELDIRLLVWDASALIAAPQGFFPQRAPGRLHPRIRIHLDDRHPWGACHHAKVRVIDDALAFCSGEDFSVERWDSPEHRDHDPRRRMPGGKLGGPRHAVTAMLDGPAAAALGDFARFRWRQATGEAVPRPPAPRADAWPPDVRPDFRDARIGVVRTLPATDAAAAVREGEALLLAAIAAAREVLYLENQYFASPAIADALAARLAEPDGPEVIVICSPESPSCFDSLTMDPARDVLVGRLRQADPHGRLRILAPHTSGGEGIVVHSKILIADDRLLRIGSSNLNGRSMWLDTECDVALEATGDAGQAWAIAAARDALIAHHLGCAPRTFAETVRSCGSTAAALDRMASPRLRRIEPATDAAVIERALGHGSADPVVLARRLARRRGKGRGVLAVLALLLLAAPLAVLLWNRLRRRG